MAKRCRHLVVILVDGVQWCEDCGAIYDPGGKGSRPKWKSPNVTKKKYKNPTLEDYLELARKRTVMSDGDSRAICMLADEVIKLRNEMPCPRCLGTPGRMCTGEAYMGGPETYDTCDKCRKHKGKKFKPMKSIMGD
jgi:hypothetical protein